MKIGEGIGSENECGWCELMSVVRVPLMRMVAIDECCENE